jgi:hypothetical protein
MAEFRYAFDPDVSAILRRAADAGCAIKVLLLHPDYGGTADIDGEEGNPPGALSTRIRKSLERFQQMKYDCGERMQLRTYSIPPTTSIVRGDDRMIVTPYVRYFAGRSSPTMELRRTANTQMFERYAQHFTSIWSTAEEYQG